MRWDAAGIVHNIAVPDVAILAKDVKALAKQHVMVPARILAHVDVITLVTD